MPLHDFKCLAMHVTERFVEHGVDSIVCAQCGAAAGKVFLRAPMGFVQADVCYDSPIDGRHITSRQARLDDMARAGCIEYDPGMKQDHARRIADSDAALDKAVETAVESQIHAMPARKREMLDAELRRGADIGITRSTLEA